MEIYKITNLVNSKIYIGLTTRTKELRFKEHLKSSIYSNYAIHRAIKKYGKENFALETLENCNSYEELVIKECYWIKNLDSMNPKLGYNMINQEDCVKIFNTEVKEKISISQIKRLKKMSIENKKALYKKASKARQGNIRKDNRLGLRGVTEVKFGRYNCEIGYEKKRYRRLFLSKEEAAKSYDKLALYLYGEDAKLNYPENRIDYLKEDLILFFDWFLNHTQKQGRPNKNLYDYIDLIPESKKNAKMNIQKHNILNTDVLDLKYLYNGEINPNFQILHNL